MFNLQQIYAKESALMFAEILALCLSAAGIFEFANSRDPDAIMASVVMILYTLYARYLIRGIKKANNA